MDEATSYVGGLSRSVSDVRTPSTLIVKMAGPGSSKLLSVPVFMEAKVP